MKKLWILIVFLLCGSLGLSQIVHAFTMEFSSCNVVKTEHHSESIKTKTDSDAVSSKTSKIEKSCCESCHTQLMSIPQVFAEKAVLSGELFAANPMSPPATFADSLSEPPQA